jgi:hypothetical protein
VLVGHRDLAALPLRADPPERRRDDLVVDLGRAEAGVQRRAGRRLGGDLVAGEQRREIAPAELLELRRVVQRVFLRPCAASP